MAERIVPFQFVGDASGVKTAAAEANAAIAGTQQKAAQSSNLAAAAHSNLAQAAQRLAIIQQNQTAINLGGAKSVQALAEHLGVMKKNTDGAGDATTELVKRVTLGRGALTGYELAIEQVIRSFGGVPIAIAVVLPLLNVLAGMLLRSRGETDKQIEVDKEALAITLARARALFQLAVAQTEATGKVVFYSGATQATSEAGARLLTQIIQLGQEQVKLNKINEKVIFFQNELAQGHGRVASAGFELMTGEANLGNSTKQLNDDLQDQIQQLTKQQRAVAPLIESLASYQRATGKSTEEILKSFPVLEKLSGVELAAVSKALDKATGFASSFAEAFAKLNRLGEISTTASTAATDAAAKRVREILEGARAQGLTQAEGFRLALKESKEFTSALREEQVAAKLQGQTVRTLAEAIGGYATGAADAVKFSEDFDNALNRTTSGAGRADAALKRYVEVLKQMRAAVADFEFQQAQAFARAGEQVERAISDINIRLLENEWERRSAQNARLLADTHARLLAETFDEEFADRQTNALRVALERETNELLARERQKFIDHLEKMARAEIVAEANARLNKTSQTPDSRLNEGIVTGTIEPPKGLPKSLEIIINDFFLSKKAADDFRKALILLNKGDTLGALKAGIKAIAEEAIRTGSIFLALGDAIGAAFESAISHQQSFGNAFKASMLKLIAQLAEFWGRFFIALGAGLLLFDPARGLALIAAGLALLALAGVFRALAANIGRQDQSNLSGSNSSGGGGGSGGPRNVPFVFPSSGGGGRPQQTVIRLDGPATRSFMKQLFDGEGVVTIQHGRVNRRAELRRGLGFTRFAADGT